MRLVNKLAAAAFAFTVSLSGAIAEEKPVLRASVLAYGTVNWELDTIKHHKLDEANGFILDVQGVAGSAAAKIAFQGGETDVIVSDWLWVARMRAAGKDYVFVPYSKAVGGLLVPDGSEAKSLADLKGGKIGIAGGPVDKSWLILRAYAEQEFAMDLARETEQVFGAPPLIFKSALSGELDGAINFWHFLAKMEASGMRQLVSVDTAAQALGLDPETPLLGYVMRAEMLRDHPELVNGMATASRGAKEILASDQGEWDRLRPRMKAKTDAQFSALVGGFRAGIPAPGPVDEEAAGRMLALMAKLGGEKLVGPLMELPDGIFYNSGS